MNTVAVVAILAAPLGIDDTPSTPGPCDEACRDALPAHGDGIAAQYLTLLEMALVGTLTDEAGQCEIWPPGSCNKTWPFEAYKRSSGLDWPPYGHTMIGHKRLRNVREAIESVVANRVDGSFAELGVWRGGTCIYARALLDLLGQRHRRVHLFDVFGTLSGYGGNAAFLRVSKEQVARNFVKYGYGDELRAGRVVMHKGLFEQTLRRFRRVWERERFAVLRIDANYYSSCAAARRTPAARALGTAGSGAVRLLTGCARRGLHARARLRARMPPRLSGTSTRYTTSGTASRSAALSSSTTFMAASW